MSLGKITWIRLLSCIGFICAAITTLAQNYVVLSDSTIQWEVNAQQRYVWVDSSKQTTFSKVMEPGFQSRFLPAREDVTIMRDTSHAFWAKLYIKDQSVLDKRWLLELPDLHFTKVEVYIPDTTGNYQRHFSGYSLPFVQRGYRHKNFVFDLPTSHKTYVLYVRVEAKSHHALQFLIRSAHYFSAYSLQEYYLLGLFYGILGIMALYNLLLFFTVKERFYLYYVLYVITAALISFAEDGIGFQFLWPNHPEWNPFITYYSPVLFLISFTLYAGSFLEFHKYLPRFSLFFYLLVGVCIVYLLFNQEYAQLRWQNYFYLFPYFLIYAAAIICFRKGFRPARFFIIGYTFVLISIIITIFRMNGWIHGEGLAGILLVYGFNIGLLLEIVILSFALGDRIRLIKAEREQAQWQMINQLKENERLKDDQNRALEEKVLERTKEIENQKKLIEQTNIDLAEANAKLRDQSEEISRINELLDEENRVLNVEKKELQEVKQELEVNVKELSKARIFLKDVDYSEFARIFPDKDSCLKYLQELKWEKGYHCKRCANEKSFAGQEPFSRRCTRCGYDESPTAYTVFHRLRFPIDKAFYMLFLIYANKGKITSVELSQILSLRQSTCWTFRKKVLDKMAGRKKDKLQDVNGWNQLVLD